MAWLDKGLRPDTLARARGLFDRALTADPDNVDALIGSAAAEALDGVNFFATDPLASFAAAEAKLTKALSSVLDHAGGHLWLGLVSIWTKRAAEGIAKCEHALEVYRNLANAHAAIGFGKILIGRAEETEVHLLRPCAAAPAIRRLLSGLLTWAWRGTTSVITSKRSHGVKGHRGQPKLFESIFSVGRRPRAAWPT